MSREVCEHYIPKAVRCPECDDAPLRREFEVWCEKKYPNLDASDDADRFEEALFQAWKEGRKSAYLDVVRAASIATREYVLGFCSRNLNGEAFDHLRRPAIEAAMVAAVMDSDSVRDATASAYALYEQHKNDGF